MSKTHDLQVCDKFYHETYGILNILEKDKKEEQWQIDTKIVKEPMTLIDS